MSNFQEIKSPHNIYDRPEGNKTIFLAGSISMGKAVDWQSEVAEALCGYSYTLFNPRRDDWDSSWEQRIYNKAFYEQVQWELEALTDADLIIMYFDKNTISPISLLELGLHANSGKIVVCCPEGYFRKGNVEIICDNFNIPLVNSLEGLICLAQNHHLLL